MQKGNIGILLNRAIGYFYDTIKTEDTADRLLIKYKLCLLIFIRVMKENDSLGFKVVESVCARMIELISARIEEINAQFARSCDECHEDGLSLYQVITPIVLTLNSARWIRLELRPNALEFSPIALDGLIHFYQHEDETFFAEVQSDAPFHLNFLTNKVLKIGAGLYFVSSPSEDQHYVFYFLEDCPRNYELELFELLMLYVGNLEFIGVNDCKTSQLNELHKYVTRGQFNSLSRISLSIDHFAECLSGKINVSGSILKLFLISEGIKLANDGKMGTAKTLSNAGGSVLNTIRVPILILCSTSQLFLDSLDFFTSKISETMGVPLMFVERVFSGGEFSRGLLSVVSSSFNAVSNTEDSIANLFFKGFLGMEEMCTTIVRSRYGNDFATVTYQVFKSLRNTMSAVYELSSMRRKVLKNAMASLGHYRQFSSPLYEVIQLYNSDAKCDRNNCHGSLLLPQSNSNAKSDRNNCHGSLLLPQSNSNAINILSID